jgi:hypothetical protein
VVLTLKSGFHKQNFNFLFHHYTLLFNEISAAASEKNSLSLSLLPSLFFSSFPSLSFFLSFPPSLFSSLSLLPSLVFSFSLLTLSAKGRGRFEKNYIIGSVAAKDSFVVVDLYYSVRYPFPFPFAFNKHSA